MKNTWNLNNKESISIKFKEPWKKNKGKDKHIQEKKRQNARTGDSQKKKFKWPIKTYQQLFDHISLPIGTPKIQNTGHTR